MAGKYNKGGKKWNNQDGGRVNNPIDYSATAPYNFIELPKEVFIRYNSVNDIPAFDKFDKDLNTGYIEYKFINETPVFVGAEKSKDKDNKECVEFFRNAKGQIAIPGSSMKGMVRANTEILGFGYPQFIEDRLFLYRKFASDDSSKDQYKRVISLKKGEGIDSVVSAGYIEKRGTDYYLIPAKKVKGKTFFAISETLLRKQKLPENKINYMYNKSLLNFKGKGLKAWSNFANNNRNKNYKPYSVDITFDVDSENHMKKISLGKDGIYKGILCNSNSLGVKKKHYIVNEIDRNQKAYKIEEKDIIAYKNDCEMNKQRTNKEYYYLPGEKGSFGNVLPFFYKLENGKVKYFGRTPYLRIFYKKSVRDCINTKYTKGIDYPNAIYGYTISKDEAGPIKEEKNKKQNNFKSRVSFTDAICENPKVIKEMRKLALSSPKPTSYTIYLSQNGVTFKKDMITYSTDGRVDIRGRKFYWLHDEQKYVASDASENIMTNIKNLLNKNSKFIGKIYFENLTDDELGLLLLSLKYGRDCKDNIGMGKPLGYGKINIKNINLYLENINNKFLTLNNEYKEVDIQKYKFKYMEYISEFTNRLYKCNYKDVKEIKNFVTSKTYELNSQYTRYMALNDKENKDKSKKTFKDGSILPTVEDIKKEVSVLKNK